MLVGWTDQPLPFHRSTSGPLKMSTKAPTATQAVGKEHATAFSFDAPVGTGDSSEGVGSIDQLVPFHRSTNAAASELPTAVQSVVDTHETPLRLLFIAPEGFTVGKIDQLVPFHSSASVNVSPAVLPWLPTATHAFADAHDTPDRLLLVAATESGLRCTDPPDASAPDTVDSQTPSATTATTTT